MLNTKLGKAYGGQLFWKIWNPIDIEQLAQVWNFSDSMDNYLQRPNQVLAGCLNFQTFADRLILKEFKKILTNWPS